MTLALYLHFPFCRNRCSNCDFYKELYDRDQETLFYDTLRIETEFAAESIGRSDITISTIFIGGGTPSLTNLDRFADWLAQIRRLFDIPDGIEFSVENNPDSITKELLESFRQMGVNRPTFGVQSFHPGLLKLLNRKHRPEDSYRAVYLTNALGYGNFGVDLIFGLPNQSSKMLSKDLDEIIDLDPPHISFYQLTVEPGTTLAERVASGSLVMPDQEVSIAYYRGGCERLAEAGYQRYEVSSFAKPGFECRHNQSYWDGSDYLGLGPSAHSFVAGQRFANVPDLRQYVASVRKGNRPLVPDDSGPEERMTEAIMLGLRTSRGIDRAGFATRFGHSLESRLNTQQFDLLVNSGHVLAEEASVRLSDDGICLADEIARRLLR